MINGYDTLKLSHSVPAILRPRFLRGAVYAACLVAPSVVYSSDDADAFVEANLLATFYHELGHALIDLQNVQIYGQEEDAADVFAVFLIDALYEEDDAQELMAHVARGFQAEAQELPDLASDRAWWDVHGQDEQRYFNSVCIFYGASPDAREDLSRQLELPEERAETCPEEYDQANDAWGEILDEIWGAGEKTTVSLSADSDAEETFSFDLIFQEVAFLNEQVALASDLDVVVEDCEEANAFYDPELSLIVMCTELEDYLFELFDAAHNQ